ncbi:MAG: sulfotransferase [Phycisphaerales bacterium]
MASQPPSTFLREADRLVAAGDLAGAADTYATLLKSNPRYEHRARVRYRLGTIYSKLGRWQRAIDTLKRAAREWPDNADLLYNLAQAQIYAQRQSDAAETLARALEADPDHADSLARLATMAQYAGRPEDAAAQLEAIDRRGIRNWSVELAFATLAPKTGRNPEAIRRLRSMVDEGGLEPEERAALLLNLAYLLDLEGRYDDAWGAAEEGNAALPVHYDPARFVRDVEHSIRTVTPEVILSLPEPTDRASDVVLILGSPRSGTTLMEQIIAAHPEADSAGELEVLGESVKIVARAAGATGDASRIRRADMIKASGHYLSALRACSGQARKRIDKQPHNWHSLGLASRLLPEARVIYCDRDLRDVAISTFFRNFAIGHEYSTRLDWIGQYLRESRRLMRHWIEVIPRTTDSFKITTARYEEVVANAETESRRLVEFVGLPWDDACLRFQEHKRGVRTLYADQVGRGVYKDSLERWRRYEKHLGPLMEALGDEAPRG